MVHCTAPGKGEENVGADGQLYKDGNGENDRQSQVSVGKEDNPPEKEYIHGNLRVEEAKKDVAKKAAAALDHQITGQVVVGNELLKEGLEADWKGKSPPGVPGEQLLQPCLALNQVPGQSEGAQEDGAGEEDGVANEAHQHVESAGHL